jgi:hypothetical protein
VGTLTPFSPPNSPRYFRQADNSKKRLGLPRSPPPFASPPATRTSSSKPTTRPSRCTSRACAWTGPGRTSWTRGRPGARSPRSPTAAGSAISAASTAPSSRPTQSAPKNCATPQPARQNPRRPSSGIPGTARHTASQSGPPGLPVRNVSLAANEHDRAGQTGSHRGLRRSGSGRRRRPDRRLVPTVTAPRSCDTRYPG